MADTATTLNSLVPKISTAGILSAIFWILMCILVLSITGYYLYYIIKKKKYSQYRIIIWEQDSTGNTHESYDRGGVFVDKKTGLKLLFMQKSKKGLNPNNIPYVTAKDKKGRLVKTVYVQKTGVSNYRYVSLKVAEDVKFTIGEEDINWASQDLEVLNKTFNKESWLTKYAPYIVFIITIMIVMILLISLFNKFSVLKEISDNMLKITELQAGITEHQYNITRTPMMNPGQPIIVPSGAT